MCLWHWDVRSNIVKVLRLSHNLCLTLPKSCLTLRKCCASHEIKSPIEKTQRDTCRSNALSRKLVSQKVHTPVPMGPVPGPFRGRFAPCPSPQKSRRGVAPGSPPEHAKHAQGAHFEHFLSPSAAHVTQSAHLSPSFLFSSPFFSYFLFSAPSALIDFSPTAFSSLLSLLFFFFFFRSHLLLNDGQPSLAMEVLPKKDKL